MIIDFIKVPVDKYGNLMYDYENTVNIIKAYSSIFPDRQALIIPENIHIWENADLESLKYLRDFIIKIIEEKEEGLEREVED